jgi:predicted N-acetyltransferase YhbS
MMNNKLFTQRPMRESDLGRALELTQAEGWPHRAEDWALHFDQGRGWVACDDNDCVIGTTLIWEYGEAEEIATVGLIVVDRSWQGKGVGKALLSCAIENTNVETLRLMSTVAGLKLYSKCGFKKIGVVEQRQAIPKNIAAIQPPLGVSLRAPNPADVDALIKLDALAFGCRRDKLIKTLLKSASAILLEDKTGLCGFACIRHGGRGMQFGPVIANDEHQAIVMISTLLQQITEFTRLDVPADALELAAWLDEVGLPVVDQVTAMQRGGASGPIDGQARTFALVSQAFG